MTNLKTKIEALEKELAELKAQVEKPWPQVGDVIYALYAGGHVRAETFQSWAGGPGFLEQGNVFTTRKAAEKERDRRKAQAEMLKVIAEERGDWVPDWGDRNQVKHIIMWDHMMGCAIVACATEAQVRPNDWYFPPGKYEHRAISRLSPETIKTALGVG